jgi:hypothetical protein
MLATVRVQGASLLRWQRARFIELGEAAWAWVWVSREDGPWLPEVVDDGRPVAPGGSRLVVRGDRPGRCWRDRPVSRCERRRAGSRPGCYLARRQAHTRTEPSLYSGLGGDVTALRLLAPGSRQGGVQRLAELMTPAGWDTMDIGPGPPRGYGSGRLGAAGVVWPRSGRGGEHAGRSATVGDGCRLADQTTDGRTGECCGLAVRMPNFSHGTAGMLPAMAIAGAALDRMTSSRLRPRRAAPACRGSLDDGGFVVPAHPAVLQPGRGSVTYTWCHGRRNVAPVRGIGAEAWTR